MDYELLVSSFCHDRCSWKNTYHTQRILDTSNMFQNTNSINISMKLISKQHRIMKKKINCKYCCIPVTFTVTGRLNGPSCLQRQEGEMKHETPFRFLWAFNHQNTILWLISLATFPTESPPQIRGITCVKLKMANLKYFCFSHYCTPGMG